MAYRHVLITHDFRRQLRSSAPREFVMARLSVHELPLGPKPHLSVVTVTPQAREQIPLTIAGPSLTPQRTA